MLVLLLAVAVGACPAKAQYSQVIMVLWHGAEVHDLLEIAPHMPQAWGLMNTRTGGGAGVEGAYLSISSGARAVGVAGAGAAFNQDEDHTYTLNTGLEPWAVVQPEVWRIRQGQNTTYTVRPGALGTALAEGGLSAAAFGNSDTDRFARWAGAIAGDELGRVPEGTVGRGLLVSDEIRPFGVGTDYDRLLELVLGSSAHFIAVDLGDPYRFDEAASSFLPSQYQRLREEMVAEARGFILRILQELPDSSAVLVVSPHPGRTRASQSLWLAPVVLFGEETGLLTSPTTKWPGIITNMDIAPTVLELLGLNPPLFMIGSGASVLPMPLGSAQGHVEQLEQKLLWLSAYRGPVLRGLVGTQIGVYLAALAAMTLDTKLPGGLVSLIQLLLILALAVPAYLLVMPLGVWAALVLTGALVLVKFISRAFLWMVAGVGLITALLVGLDTLTGSSLMRFSFLGYDPIGGARFYGLGNEYMGIMIGALIMGWMCLAELLKLTKGAAAAGAIPLFLAATALVAAPWWGTNVGGAITAVLGFGVTLGALCEVRLSWRAAGALTLALCIVLGIFMLIDSSRPLEEQSHIGRTVQLIAGDGAIAVYNIIQRKLSMNLRLIRYSIWSRAWIMALGIMGASFIRPSRFMVWLKEKYPQLAKGLWGTVVAGTAALVFNDSGVVAAATCVFFAATTMAVLALDYRLLKHDLLPPKAHVEDDTDGH
ncbi:MAG TPA: hypothetical protein GX008_01230 [Firmicutes bacterium]|nr:hypothetical protein [Bacillota bacterium]